MPREGAGRLKGMFVLTQFPGLKSKATFEVAHLLSCAVPERSTDEPAFGTSRRFRIIKCRFCILARVTVW
jgi:hypothetical protein